VRGLVRTGAQAWDGDIEFHELASDRAGTRGGKLRRSNRLWRGLPDLGAGPEFRFKCLAAKGCQTATRYCVH